MAFTTQDVADKAILLGSLDTSNESLIEKLNLTIEMVIAKADAYVGYDCTTVDALRNILAEISVTQLARYQNLQGTAGSASGATKRITRGDYTVEYDTSVQAQTTSVDVFNSYEWLLKKYKKLVSL